MSRLYAKCVINTIKKLKKYDFTVDNTVKPLYDISANKKNNKVIYKRKGVNPS